ncbi:hypothetical protein HAX54_051584, partial [Datura stramonium]|nr:hypothetical protein [Datura stramonium]
LSREQLFKALERFKQYILRAPNHGFPEHILLEKFYIGLYPLRLSIAKMPLGMLLRQDL